MNPLSTPVEIHRLESQLLAVNVGTTMVLHADPPQAIDEGRPGLRASVGGVERCHERTWRPRLVGPVAVKVARSRRIRSWTCRMSRARSLQ